MRESGRQVGHSTSRGGLGLRDISKYYASHAVSKREASAAIKPPNPLTSPNAKPSTPAALTATQCYTPDATYVSHKPKLW